MTCAVQNAACPKVVATVLEVVVSSYLRALLINALHNYVFIHSKIIRFYAYGPEKERRGNGGIPHFECRVSSVSATAATTVCHVLAGHECTNARRPPFMRLRSASYRRRFVPVVQMVVCVPCRAAAASAAALLHTQFERTAGL